MLAPAPPDARRAGDRRARPRRLDRARGRGGHRRHLQRGRAADDDARRARDVPPRRGRRRRDRLGRPGRSSSSRRSASGWSCRSGSATRATRGCSRSTRRRRSPPGCETRPLEETVRDTLDWVRSGEAPIEPPAGLDRAKEQAVLDSLALERVVSKHLFRELAHPRRPARDARARPPDAARAARPPAHGRAGDRDGVRARRRRQPVLLQLPPARAREVGVRRGGRGRRRPRAAVARDRGADRVPLRRARGDGPARRARRAASSSACATRSAASTSCPPRWRRAAQTSSATLELTPLELEELGERFEAAARRVPRPRRDARHAQRSSSASARPPSREPPPRPPRLPRCSRRRSISSLGTQMTWLALPWFVLRTTGSPQQMTWVIIAEVVPIGVLGFWGGAIASRVGTRRTMLACDIARAPLLAAIPLLHSAGCAAVPGAARARRGDAASSSRRTSRCSARSCRSSSARSSATSRTRPRSSRRRTG